MSSLSACQASFVSETPFLVGSVYPLSFFQYSRKSTRTMFLNLEILTLFLDDPSRLKIGNPSLSVSEGSTTSPPSPSSSYYGSFLPFAFFSRFFSCFTFFTFVSFTISWISLVSLLISRSTLVTAGEGDGLSSSEDSDSKFRLRYIYICCLLIIAY